jgi:hypothetical protein
VQEHDRSQLNPRLLHTSRPSRAGWDSPAGGVVGLMADLIVAVQRPAVSRPVSSANAGRNLGLLVVSFGVTVVVTRLFLVSR